MQAFPEVRPHRKKVQSVGTIGIQAIEYLKEILTNQFHTEVIATQCDVFVALPTIPDRAKKVGNHVSIYVNDRERDVFVEMVFTTGQLHDASMHAKVVAKF